MHLWVLCLKLWWLALPLSTLQHPSSSGGRSTELLTPRDAELASGLKHANVANELDRRARSIVPFFTRPNGELYPGNRPFLPGNAIFNPKIFDYTGPGRLLNYSSNNPDPYPVADQRDREPEPPWPPVDPYPPQDPSTWSFDYVWPPVGPKVVEIKGEINLKSTETNIYVIILGFPLGDYRGNLHEGVRVDINLSVVKGYLDIYEIQGKPKDQIWMKLDLKTFLRHWTKTIHMFDVPHQDRVKPKPAETA
ncbi:MAG: hypothetical protein Q9224_004545, partial [Gallowayella concinna]